MSSDADANTVRSHWVQIFTQVEKNIRAMTEDEMELLIEDPEPVLFRGAGQNYFADMYGQRQPDGSVIVTFTPECEDAAVASKRFRWSGPGEVQPLV